MRVLLVRPEAEARRFAGRLQEAGHEVLVSPVLDIRPTGNARPDGPFDALIASSARAFELLSLADAERLRVLPLFAVGERSAKSAQACGFPPPFALGTNAAELIAAIAKVPGSGRHFLYLAGERRKPALEAALRAAGHAVTAWEIYNAVAAPTLTAPALAALGAGQIDAVLHFSRRSAEIFAGLAAAAGLRAATAQALHICISSDAAAGLTELGPVRARIAETPDSNAMLALLHDAGG
ncbi:MAG: uroporphyrinogen-III synthase [Beijerinckiaceae bacterium]